jgi:hypothetical protein
MLYLNWYIYLFYVINYTIYILFFYITDFHFILYVFNNFAHYTYILWLLITIIINSKNLIINYITNKLTFNFCSIHYITYL